MELFFEDFPAPDGFEETCDNIRQFLKHQVQQKRNVVLITSGGTAVPMETRTVRFIDNFSTGTRGAASTEYFLASGYGVIFLHRKQSKRPFIRHFPEDVLFDLFTLAKSNDCGSSAIEVNSCHTTKLTKVFRAQRAASSSNSLLSIPFFSLQDYLYLLKAASEALHGIGQSAMFLLAAAVSDFYIPRCEMPEHKLQSSDGPPQVKLESVPKMLSVLIHQWAPQGFVISFKLETDPQLLLQKARKALDKNKHEVVVANLLEERRRKVTVVTPDSEADLELSDEQLHAGKEVEELLVHDLIARHSAFIHERGGQ